MSSSAAAPRPSSPSPNAVYNGAMCNCTMGMAPSVLVVMPTPAAAAGILGNQIRANILDNAPMLNIQPFGLCTSMANPTVAAASAGAQGALTPSACIPAIASPWMPGDPSTLIDGKPALTKTSSCICSFGGVINIID
jgi:Domain of unknown function (DUF4280)